LICSHFVIGIIVGTHGIEGRLRVRPLTDEPDRFLKLTRILLKGISDSFCEYEVTEAKLHHRQVLLRLNGIDSIDKAQELINRELCVARSEALALDKNSWYIADLIGCRVYDITRGYLGTVKDILQQPHHDVYIVEDKQKKKKDLLFPALKSILISIDPYSERIDVELPAGLYEIYRESER
jgi:16S rRNA processing protein RimM